MENNMKSFILIGNSTFAFKEDDTNLVNVSNCQDAKTTYQSEPKSEEKQNFVPIKTITITPMGESSQNSMEPCLLDNNFGQFGYFTQDYSKLTVYLNDSNLLNDETKTPSWAAGLNLQSSDCIENYPFFNHKTNVDFPFIDANKLSSMNKIQFDSRLPCLNIINGKIESDAPEYIDINSLVLSNELQDCLSLNSAEIKKKASTVPLFLKRNRKPKNKDVVSNAAAADDANNDDDVIFVKEYKNDEAAEVKEKQTPKKEPPKKQAKILPEPRRNPKRQVQLQKVSYELASKLTFDDYYQSSRKASASSKKQSKQTGAVFCPPTPLSNDDFKEWPVEGMHEKPNFNPITKKIEILPHPPKRARFSTKTTQPIKRKTQYTRRKTIKQKNNETNKMFASMAHNMLHYILDYVEQIKEYNQLLRVKQLDDVNSTNLRSANDILSDSCSLYCIANGVSDNDLANYLYSISSKENASHYLNEVISEFESAKKV